MDGQSRIGPVSLSERIEVLDVLRGMALFGIITANMRAFNGPLAGYIDHTLMWTDLPNRLAQMFIDLFISGKFVTLFSFMFGIGFAVQMDRAAARGMTGRAVYARRLAVLFLIGIAHMYLLWWGDILMPYALMGFLLLAFRRRSQKTILAWSAALYCWPWIMGAAFLAASMAGSSMSGPAPVSAQELQRLIHVHATGTYMDIFRERMKENQLGIAFIFFWAPRLLGIFLFGLWVWRRGIVRDVAGNVSLLRRCRTWGYAVGIPLNLLMVAIAEIWHPNPVKPGLLAYAHGIVAGVGMPALSLAYASTVALLFLRPEWVPRLRPFAAVGRTALSNYLMQTVICTTLYYGYGFGLYGSVGPLLGLVPTVVIYSAQVVMSVWWTRRFAYGPMEWIWRTLTYGRQIHTAARSASA